MAKERIKELDYLKGIMILLMVIFHLVYIGDKYPYLKQLVYTFHIPVFLILSGYLANVNKSRKSFGKTISGILIPYAVMETLYASMTAFLPVRDRIDSLTFSTVIEKVVCAPLGPYWYLHTLIICLSAYYIVYNLPKLNAVSKFILMGLVLYGLSLLLDGFAFSRVVYFMTGVAISQSKRPFTEVIPRSAWSILPLLILCAQSENLHYTDLPGYIINLLVISFLLYLFQYTPGKIRSGIDYLGENTLPILVFSPIFTILTKSFVPFFQFDPTGIVFTIVATTFVVAGSLILAVLSDKLKISRFFFRREVVYSPFTVVQKKV